MKAIDRGTRSYLLNLQTFLADWYDSVKGDDKDSKYEREQLDFLIHSLQIMTDDQYKAIVKRMNE